MEQALQESRCSLKAWIPDSQDIQDEEAIVLSRSVYIVTKVKPRMAH